MPVSAPAPTSIRSRLSWMFSALAVLLLVVGTFILWRFSEANAASAQIRDRWLVATRLLGDLNNATSDYRAAEANHLLAHDSTEMGRSESDIRTLSKAVTSASENYGRLPHDADETRLWRVFADNWHEYERIADRVVRLSRSGHKSQGTALYLDESRLAYGRASDALEALTAKTVASAKDSSDRSERIFRTTRIVIVLATSILIAMGLFLLVHIRRDVVEPILQMAGRMRALANNETEITTDGVDRPDEIGEMARSIMVFRDNAIELAHSQRGLEQQAGMLAEKLEHERRLTDQQRNFVTMASHEFKTPLTVIDGQAQRLIRLSETGISAGEVADRARKLRQAVRRMTTLIDRLSNALRVLEDSGGLYFHPAPFNLAETLHEVCQTYREITPGAQIVENLRRAPQLMKGDPALLYQAFGNLLSNAIKYSPDGSLIELSAWEAGGAAVVSVTDRGIGVPPGDIPNLFSRHFRGGNVGGTVGAGIGLYLVKTVVDLHGGTIAVDSAERRGTRLEIRLPLNIPGAESPLGDRT